MTNLILSLFEDYFPLIISNLLVVLFFIFFQNNKKKASTAYQNQIALLEGRSLRAQMNPHFIYNALNSLQSIMILKGERESNRYIGMLSKLLRFTLEMSTQESIALQTEMDFIEAYMGLQKNLDQLSLKAEKEIFKRYRPVHLITELYYGNIQLKIAHSLAHKIKPLLKASPSEAPLTHVKQGKFDLYEFKHQHVPFAMRLEALKNFRS
ncbi:MAG: histidine kinase [Bacteroidetes bacterium]|nr:histidine kinase [Bacteroidota bacterium]MDA0985192.1 histidine kinase [Bacteroidota bacterium]